MRAGSNSLLDVRGRDVPGCPVVKTVLSLHSLNRGTGSIPACGTKSPHVTWQGKKIKKVFLRKEGGEGMSQAV